MRPEPSAAPAHPGPPGGRLPRSVVLLGVVSLLTDVSSEMIFTLLPAFLAARVGAAPVLLGAMEGAGELVASVLKVQSGVWADRASRLKPLVVAGYTLSTLARPLMAFVGAWWQPLLVRMTDRVGKGLRSAPRDVLLTRAVLPGQRGAAFGFHRAMDHAGAALGALVASLLVAAGLSLPHVFLASLLPGALAVGALLLVREPLEPTVPLAPMAAREVRVRLPRSLWRFYGPLGLFALSRATDAFLLLLLTAQGAPPSLLPLAWLLLHVAKAGLSWPAGRLADRLGAGRLVLAGWALYALSCALLALSPSIPFTLACLGVYGFYQALSEGAEKALLAALAPAGGQGRAFGLYHGLVGAASLGAGLWFGLLWQQVSPPAAWAAAGALALGACALLALLRPRAAE